ncbi:High-affinity leucine-specific transport system, periplasmic binding protein LivK [Hyalangium minutum]|uniref:High-affinity leucine-specific transport system, periplasmic binding protein LivK n=1 Tax=Hyalangium minutum TaxID=394096 RepID=A0A085WCA2_9BACT|nr:High-affinity leucine-specific transport system, periplasmic binding protein LivK [Hyalangium minutum]
MPIHPRFSCLVTVLLLALSACTEQPTGSVQFAVSVPQALSASDVTRVQVTVSASDMSSLVVELAKTHGTWGGLVGNIPAGVNRAFLAEAFDASGALRFRGSTSAVTINADQTLAVALTLQELAPAPPFSNEAPIIDSLVASSTSVQAGASVSLTTTVHDPNAGDTLALAWTATGGTFSAPTAATTTWTAPASLGVQTLTFTVTDSQRVAVSVSLAVNVVPGTSTGSAAINVSFNLWPVISQVSASPSRLDAGQSTTVSAQISDADGDALTYQWTASCPGTWTNAASSTASFVPSSVPASACNNCRLTVTVQDGRGGQTTGDLNLCITTSSTERFPPNIINSFQSAASAAPGETVSFDVTAMDAQASSLTFAWTASIGVLGTPATDASTSHITWTAPSCVPSGATPTVMVTVTNAFNLTATRSFTVTGPPVCTVGWASAASMATTRREHTATLLPNGKVLVAGGYNGGHLATAALYDPATGTWSTTGSMIIPRSLHVAVLLNNGKVFIVGGTNGSPLLSAEVYDPATGTWSAAGVMSAGRWFHTATLLPTGKVLVAGGHNYNNGYLPTAELYDPASNTWSTTASMTVGRHRHTATLLPNGKVLVAGGSDTFYHATAMVYDPATGTWSATGSMASPRQIHTATLLPNGKVLVAGGQNGSTSYLATATVYDPATGTWSTTGAMATTRQYHTAILLSNGKVLVAGGQGSSDALSSAELYDSATGTWSSAGSMPSARQLHAATLLPNNKVFVTGGYSASSSYLAGTALYSP